MTKREFLVAVVEANVNEDITTFANQEIGKMDARNEKRSSKPSKTAIANVPIKESIATLLVDKGMFASDIAVALGISTQKASALCRQLVEDKVLTVTDVKVPKKGLVKQYTHC